MGFETELKQMRNYKRVSMNGSWSFEDLQQATKAVKNGLSIRSSAKKHGIPESTLRRKIKKKDVSPSHFGRKSYFSPEQEKLLSKYLVNMSNMFYGLTGLKFRRVAFELAEKLEVKHNFNKANKVAGKDWLKGFFKRNPELSIRKPEATSINRIKGFCRTEVEKFYRNLHTLYDDYHFDADQVFNMDETGISTVQVRIILCHIPLSLKM